MISLRLSGSEFLGVITQKVRCYYTADACRRKSISGDDKKTGPRGGECMGITVYSSNPWHSLLRLCK